MLGKIQQDGTPVVYASDNTTYGLWDSGDFLVNETLEGFLGWWLDLTDRSYRDGYRQV